jgi:5'-3' exonuclease
MIIFDFNQVAISNLMEQIGSSKAPVDETLVRHMILNTIRTYVKKYKDSHGPEVIIACDNRHYWRREIFPFYKANRKTDREKSAFDWSLIFETLNKIRDELKLNFPYRVLEVEGAEADDIIAVLSARLSENEEILILSSDKDFVQLQKFANVTQYSPILKRFIKTENPLEYIKEHIIKGDRGDGIPNFLSPDNTFVVGERQKVINKKKLIEWINSEPEKFCVTDNMLRGYKRNQMLVDLNFIPEKIKGQIVVAYDTVKPANKQKMLNYFIENRLKNLIEVLDEF